MGQGFGPAGLSKQITAFLKLFSEPYSERNFQAILKFNGYDFSTDRTAHKLDVSGLIQKMQTFFSTNMSLENEYYGIILAQSLGFLEGILKNKKVRLNDEHREETYECLLSILNKIANKTPAISFNYTFPNHIGIFEMAFSMMHTLKPGTQTYEQAGSFNKTVLHIGGKGVWML